MYVREFSFSSTPDKRVSIEALADGMYQFTRTLKGFERATYLVSEDECRYSAITEWATKDDAETAGETLNEKLGSALEGIATEPPQVVVSEVYQPKG